MLNIPMPGMPGDAMLNGFNTQSNHLARLLQAKLQQQQMAQQNQQFGQSFGLQQAQENRLATMNPYEQALLQAKTAQAQGEANQLAFQQNLFKNLLGGQPTTSSGLPLGSSTIGSAQAGFLANGQAEQLGSHRAQGGSAPNGPVGFENMMNNPLLAGMFKKITGVDPYNESPGAKSARDFSDFTRKEEYKQNKPKNLLSPSRVDALQKSIIGIDQVLPMLEKLKDTNPGRFTGLWRPSDEAEYEGTISNIIEPLLAAKGLAGTVENSHTMRKTVARKKNEDFDRWIKRVEHEVKTLSRIKKENTEMLGEGTIIPKSNGSKKGIINGRSVTVSPENIESFKSSGGVISD